MMFKIVGMGPGHSDYVLPIAKRALDEADVIIGGKRHIEPFQKTDKELIHVEGQLSKLPEMIRGRQGQNIVVAVSGDTGFYSLLSYMKKISKRKKWMSFRASARSNICMVELVGCIKTVLLAVSMDEILIFPVWSMTTRLSGF